MTAHGIPHGAANAIGALRRMQPDEAVDMASFCCACGCDPWQLALLLEAGCLRSWETPDGVWLARPFRMVVPVELERLEHTKGG